MMSEREVKALPFQCLLECVSTLDESKYIDIKRPFGVLFRNR